MTTELEKAFSDIYTEAYANGLNDAVSLIKDTLKLMQDDPRTSVIDTNLVLQLLIDAIQKIVQTEGTSGHTD